jgi:hypothetical protein
MSLGLGVGYYSLGGEDMASAVSTDLKQATSGTAAGLKLWLKNDTGVTAAKWTDSSGLDNHATQSTEGNQAAVSSGGLDFERGESDHYDLATKIDIADNGGFCVAFVVTKESDDAACLFSDGTAELLQFQSATTFRVKCVNTSGTSTVTDAVFSAGTFATGTKFLFLVNRSAGASNRFTFFKNGTQLTADTDTSSNEAEGENPSGIEFTVLGSRAGSGNFFDGIVHEAAIWNRSLTAQEIADVNSYLQGIHGL